VIRAEDLHEADYTPWEGRKMDAWPCLTVLRGKVVVENGEFKGSLNDGKWQHRKVADEMPQPSASDDRRAIARFAAREKLGWKLRRYRLPVIATLIMKSVFDYCSIAQLSLQRI